MADTVIYPLSDNTGRNILNALLRIASATERIAASMEDGGESESSVSGRTLTTSGSVSGRTLSTGSGASVSGRTLSV